MPGPEKVRYSHQAMADLILANPAISQNELAGHFGYTPGWVSQIVNSDAFQAFLATRKEELVNPVITASVEEKLMTLAKKSLDVLHEKLANGADGEHGANGYV
jgi:DNA-binding MarR family transcriptional regulator